MAFCPGCGAEVVESAGFCVKCGSPLKAVVRVCPNCGAKVDDETAVFCAECGSQLQKLRPTARGPTPTFAPTYREFVPEQVKGWSWGGFYFTWLWGVCNGVWISLLTLIPYVGIVMMGVLGAKGKEWAWKKGTWTSVEEFQRIQHRWSIAAGIVFSVSCLLIAFIIILVAATAE